jgi:hypothetical protein
LITTKNNLASIKIDVVGELQQTKEISLAGEVLLNMCAREKEYLESFFPLALFTERQVFVFD